jgi:hypothetical protein
MSFYGAVSASRRGLATYFMSFAFCFLFMSVAPLMQLGAQTDPVYLLGDVVAQASLCALMFTLIGVLRVAHRHVDRSTKVVRTSGLPNSAMAYFTLSVATGSITLVSFILFAPALFSSREGFELYTSAIFGDQAMVQLITPILLLVPIFGSAIGFRSAFEARDFLWTLVFAFLLGCGALLNNPIIMPRFALAGVIFFLIDYIGRGRHVRWMSVLIAVGICVAPLLHVMRYETSEDSVPQSTYGIFDETFLAMDYDAFQLLTYTIVAVDRNGVTGGGNILGAVLFFVPRAWWPNKPEPSAKEIAKTIDHFRAVPTDNLSTPIMAEGFFALSWLGAFGISIAWWSVLTFIERRAVEFPESLMSIYKSVAVGLMLIVLRGTLMIGIAAFVGWCAAASLVWFIFQFGKSRLFLRRYAAGP